MNTLVVFLLTLLLSQLAFANCEIRPGPKGGLALFKNKKMLSIEHTQLPELVIDDFKDGISTGVCRNFKAKKCEIVPLGEQGLYIKREGVRVSDLWTGMPEFAYNSLIRLIDIGYCSHPVPQDCKITEVSKKKFIIKVKNTRISQYWLNQILISKSLEKLQDIGYCR